MIPAMDPVRTRRWLRAFKGGLALALLAAVLVYLGRNAHMVRDLPRLSPAAWLAIAAITALGTVLSAATVQWMLAAIGARTRFWEMYLLHNAAYLLNLLPLKAGTVMRAAYLRSRHGFSYSRFGVFAVYLTLLTALITAAVGLGCLVTAYGLGTTTNRVFAVLLAGSVALTGSLLLLPLPVPSWGGRLGGLLRDLLRSRRELLARPRSLAAPAAGLLAVYLLGVLRLGVIFAGLGLEARPAGLLLLGALGQLSLLANLTPGGLGVRELLVGVGATVLGVPMEAGLVAALIERAVGLVWAALVGGPSAAWVWRLQRRGAIEPSPEAEPPQVWSP